MDTGTGSVTLKLQVTPFTVTFNNIQLLECLILLYVLATLDFDKKKNYGDPGLHWQYGMKSTFVISLFCIQTCLNVVLLWSHSIQIWFWMAAQVAAVPVADFTFWCYRSPLDSVGLGYHSPSTIDSNHSPPFFWAAGKNSL